MFGRDDDRAVPMPSCEKMMPEGFVRDVGADAAAAVQAATSSLGAGVVRLPDVPAAWRREFLQAYDARFAQLERQGARPEPPNTMHDAGAALDAIGWSGGFDAALDGWLRPLAAQLFAEHGGAELDLVYGFIAEYGDDGDDMLGFHADQADVTLNVCLDGDFRGSELYFRGCRCALHRQDHWRDDEEFDVVHEPGLAILHAGAHRHGVRWIDSGRRRNLILWLRRSQVDPAAVTDCPDWCRRARRVD